METSKKRPVAATFVLSLLMALAFTACAPGDATGPGPAAEVTTDTTSSGPGPGSAGGGSERMRLGVNMGFYNPGAGMRVFREGYDPAAWAPGDRPFDETFLSELSLFESIRFHQFHRVSFSNEVEWTDRTPPDHEIPLEGWHEVKMPYEWEIRLANELGVDYWVNAPALATDEYFQRLAELVHRELDPELSVYVEWSNEVWNPAYGEGAPWDDVPGYNGQYTVAGDRGGTMGLATSTGTEDEARAKYYVYRSVRLWSAFLDAFEDDERVIEVLATVNDDEFFWDGGFQLEALSDPAINPLGLSPDILSLAAYVGVDDDGAAPDLFDGRLPGDIPPLIEGYELARAALDAAGLQATRLNAYEGGHFITRNADVAARDPRMYDVLSDLLIATEAVGLESFQFYSATSIALPTEANGFNEYTGQSLDEAHAWRALRDWRAGP